MSETANMLDMFSRAVEEFGDLVIGPPPKFTESTNKIPRVRAEYCLTEQKLMFHFWPDQGTEFPVGLEAAIKAALRGLPEERSLVEYVPEVGSWYTHVVDPPLCASVELAEHLIHKVARALQDG
jgi:hypothetical protein